MTFDPPPGRAMPRSLVSSRAGPSAGTGCIMQALDSPGTASTLEGWPAVTWKQGPAR
jgi:hypothetical protein